MKHIPLLAFACLAGVLVVSCFDQAVGDQPESLGEQTATVTGITSDLSAGSGHACAIEQISPQVANTWCWGSGYVGQRGDGTNTDANTPISVSPTAREAVQVSAGGAHTCGVYFRSGQYSLLCWGRGSDGQLGTGNGSNSSTPTLATIFASSSVKPQVATGRSHTCALRSGVISCWGDNSYGQLGNNSTTTGYALSTVQGISNATKVAASGETSCALLSTGQVKCWGNDDDGQLGISVYPIANDRSLTPVLTTLSSVKDISLGASHGCALLTSGQVKCWGRGDDGQLGIGFDISAMPLPLTVPGLNAISIGAGHRHTCAVRTNGTVACWGVNFVGQLGNGTETNSPSPVTVTLATGASLTNAVQVVAGSDFSCARLSNNEVKCWGINVRGELGHGGPTGYEGGAGAPAHSVSAVTTLLP